MKLTKFERQVLINQYKIMEALEIEVTNKRDYAARIKCLMSGHAGLHFEAFDSMEDLVLSEDDSFALTVLNMYAAIEFCRADYPDAKVFRQPLSYFYGFGDTVEELIYAQFISYILFERGEHEELKKYFKTNPTILAPQPMKPFYERMIAKWKSFYSYNKLNVERVEEIVEAGKDEQGFAPRPSKTPDCVKLD